MPDSVFRLVCSYLPLAVTIASLAEVTRMADILEIACRRVSMVIIIILPNSIWCMVLYVVVVVLLF